MQPCQYLDVSPVTPILDFWPPELEQNTFVLFEALTFVEICYSSRRRLKQRASVLITFGRAICRILSSKPQWLVQRWTHVSRGANHSPSLGLSFWGHGKTSFSFLRGAPFSCESRVVWCSISFTLAKSICSIVTEGDLKERKGTSLVV